MLIAIYHLMVYSHKLLFEALINFTYIPHQNIK
nr:MAG TPA: hypothetical protein [Caudoviricetes sp.]